MNRAKQMLVMLLVFFAGCAGSQVAMRYGAPPAHAATGVQRWEYTCKFEQESVTDMANKLGQDGWEMVAAAPWNRHEVYGGVQNGYTAWCFKRAIP